MNFLSSKLVLVKNHVQATPRVALSPLLTRLNPKEILIPSAIDAPLREMLTETGYTLTELAVSSFDCTGGESRLKTQFKVKSLDGFGQFGAAEYIRHGGDCRLPCHHAKGASTPVIPARSGTD